MRRVSIENHEGLESMRRSKQTSENLPSKVVGGKRKKKKKEKGKGEAVYMLGISGNSQAFVKTANLVECVASPFTMGDICEVNRDTKRSHTLSLFFLGTLAYLGFRYPEAYLAPLAFQISLTHLPEAANSL